MDKRLIAERFARARDTYSHEARVQQQVAEKMLQLLTERASPLFRRIVEFGCGTGSYSRLLLHKLQPESLLLNDLCPEMKECLTDLLPQDTVRFIPGDAEALDFPEKTDLITSCSTLQWFNDPKEFSPAVIVSCRKTVIWLSAPSVLKICAKSARSQDMDLIICP
jgi:ubiquinone/menaquinone biosynthesis C-methylase UbiE